MASLMKGAILHYDGQSWTFMEDPTPENFLAGVWGVSSTDVYAVGWNGTILHYDGISWTPMNSGTTEGLNGIWGFVTNSE
jgi:hypothetical protein